MVFCLQEWKVLFASAAFVSRFLVGKQRFRAALDQSPWTLKLFHEEIAAAHEEEEEEEAEEEEPLLLLLEASFPAEVRLSEEDHQWLYKLWLQQTRQR